MFGSTLKKHWNEIRRALANHKWEADPVTGIVHIERAHLGLRGTYRGFLNGAPIFEAPNLVVTEGLNYLLDCGVDSATQITAWYLALYSGAVTPAAGWNASNFASNATEITSNSEGYSQTTRRQWSPAAASAGVSSNSGSLTSFTIATATSVTVNGAGLLSNNTKGGTSGKLLSASRFPSAKSFSNADVFNLQYDLDGTST